MFNQAFVQSVARALLQMAAGYLVSKGVVDASGSDAVVGTGLSLIGVLWSYFTHATPPAAV
jgi:hypothetical protein